MFGVQGLGLRATSLRFPFTVDQESELYIRGEPFRSPRGSNLGVQGVQGVQELGPM